MSYGGTCFLVAGTPMRHAEFEECLVHEKFVNELSKTFTELQRPDMQYTDVRRDQMDTVPSGTTPPPETGLASGLISRLGQGEPDTLLYFPAQTSHAPAYTPDEQGDAMNTSQLPEPAQEPTPLSPVREETSGTFHASQFRNQQVFLCRSLHKQVLVVDEDQKDCLM